mmetsp:Transcript_18889/g.47199  ORF Transcript_18889/g.47199 Transcript_18889/m.47199 type:complete len:185 (+) Transcript_18889:124-678(+)|eukprot:CAMPEP_0178995788 /NCGR_PEP_ID=MMETSP0795-20121207/8003_1 /TAXON_ID=88552 /ORGANISM="Amoebophrya sp., Strain Ameob2" /LENGTH=184 /DNA_ID=CAMNT_0020688097 /DNA_START=41 /DNA_END=595 /DNA_ORIENTATION=-
MPSSKELAKQLKEAEKNIESVRKENEKNRVRRQKEKADDSTRLDKADEKAAALRQKILAAEAEEAAKARAKTVKTLRKQIGDKLGDKVSAGQLHVVKVKIDNLKDLRSVFEIDANDLAVTSEYLRSGCKIVKKVYGFEQLVAIFGSSKAESKMWDKRTKVTRAEMEWEKESGWMTLRIVEITSA